MARAARSNGTLRGMAVPAPVSTVDPPDLSFGPTARHLTREWWVERRLVGVGLLCALATTALGIAIPVLVQRVIDNSIVAKDHSELALYLVLIAVCAFLRFATNSTRRAITSRIGIVIENRLRAKLYDAYLDLSARVLRPPRDRAGALARDQRPLPDPLLHRLGRRAGVLERDDDRRRHDRAAQRERAPGALCGPHDAADRAAHLALRAPRDAALARRPAAQGRPHRGGRRVDRRHGDGAGVRARGRGQGALPRARRRACARRRCARRASRRATCRA